MRKRAAHCEQRELADAFSCPQLSLRELKRADCRHSKRRSRAMPGDEAAALKRGADELQTRLEWALRDHPRALKRARQRYKDFCLRLYRAIKRAGTVNR
jgi:hypothetical protein